MSEADFLDSRYAWFRLLISVLIATIGGAGLWVIVLVLPDIQTEFGISRADASLPFTMTMIGFALGNFFIGRAVDRFGVFTSLVGAAVMIGIGMGLTAVVQSVLLISILQLAVGFGTAASFGPLMADVSQWFLKRRGLAVTVTASGNYLSGALWPWLLTDVLAEDGWRAVYLAMGAICVVTLIPLALFLRRRVPLKAQQQADKLSNARARASGFSPNALAVLLGLAGIGCCVAMAMPQVHIIALCVDLGYGSEVGSQMLSLMLLGGVVSRVVSGIVADRLGGVITLLIGSVLQGISLVFYLPFDGVASLFIVSAMFGLAQGGIVPCYALVVREYMPAAEAGRRVGFVVMATVLGMALGGWMSGWIFDLTGSYEMAFVNGIAWNVLNAAIIVIILLRTRSRRASAA